jgi:hypothetical protein
VGFYPLYLIKKILTLLCKFLNDQRGNKIFLKNLMQTIAPILKLCYFIRKGQSRIKEAEGEN